MSRHEFEVPEILQEVTENFIGNNNIDIRASHLCLDIATFLTEYGQEDGDFVFRREIPLGGSLVPTKVKMYSMGLIVAIGVEAEDLNRYLFNGGLDRKVIEGKMPDDPGDFVDDVVDRPISHDATRLEIKDFQKLYDFASSQVKRSEAPKRTTGSVVDRLFKRAAAR